MHRKRSIGTIRQQIRKQFGEDAYALSMAQGQRLEQRLQSLLRPDSLRRERVSSRAMLAMALSGASLTVGLTLLHLRLASAEPPLRKSRAVIHAPHFVEILPGGITIRMVGVQFGLPPRGHRHQGDIWRSRGHWWHPDGTLDERPGHRESPPFDDLTATNPNIHEPMVDDPALSRPYAPYRFAAEVSYPVRLSGRVEFVLESRGLNVSDYGDWTTNGMVHQLATSYENIPLKRSEWGVTIAIKSGNWHEVLKTPMTSNCGTDGEFRQEQQRAYPAAAREFSHLYITDLNKDKLRTDAGYQWFTILARSKRLSNGDGVESRAFAVTRSGQRIALDNFDLGYNSGSTNGRIEQESYSCPFRLRTRDIGAVAYILVEQQEETRVHFDHIALQPKHY